MPDIELFIEYMRQSFAELLQLAADQPNVTAPKKKATKKAHKKAPTKKKATKKITKKKTKKAPASAIQKKSKKPQ